MQTYKTCKESMSHLVWNHASRVVSASKSYQLEEEDFTLKLEILIKCKIDFQSYMMMSMWYTYKRGIFFIIVICNHPNVVASKHRKSHVHFLFSFSVTPKNCFLHNSFYYVVHHHHHHGYCWVSMSKVLNYSQTASMLYGNTHKKAY